jgi:hypothetical protein
LKIEGLDQAVICARFEVGTPSGRACIGRQNERRCLPIGPVPLADQSKRFIARHHRHVDIEQEKIEGGVAGCFQSHLTVFDHRQFDGVIRVKHFLEHNLVEFIVFRDENFDAALGGGLQNFSGLLCASTVLLAKGYRAPSDPEPMRGAIKLEDVLEKVSKSGPENCLAIVDACRNSPVRSKNIDCASGLASVLARRGFYVAYSAGSGQTAMDNIDANDRSPNGLLARFLLPNLQPTTAIDEVIKRTRVDVSRVAASVGHAQNPAIYDQSTPFNLAGQSVTYQRGGEVADQTSQIADCVCLVVGVNRFKTGTIDLSFEGPLNDARNFSLSLEEHGIELLWNDILMDPNEDELLEAIEEISSLDKRVNFFFAGPGFLNRGDGYLVTNSNVPGSDNSAAITVTKLAERLERASKNVMMAIDCGLPVIEQPERMMNVTLAPSRVGTLSEFYSRRQNADQDCSSPLSILYSANFFQVAFDLQEAAMNSPFEIALANALCRPGLTMSEVSTLVRSEVADMTKRAQTPIFGGSAGALDHVWVTADPQNINICEAPSEALEAPSR